MDEIVCGKCEDGGDETRLLMCEDCPAAFHIYCLIPVLDGVPDGDWFCDACLAKRKSGGSGGQFWNVLVCDVPVAARLLLLQ